MTSQITMRQILEEDLGRVSEIHMSAFSNSALTILGHEATRRYYQWQLRGPHPHVIALGCEAQDILVGFCFAGRFHGAMQGFLQRNWSFLVWRLASHPWLLMDNIVQGRSQFGLNILRPNRAAKKPGIKTTISSGLRTFRILSIAVHSQFQGMGLGRAIMQETERIATQDGFHMMRLSVSLENSHTIRFYESQGWQRVPNTEDWSGAMVKTLPLEYVIDDECF